MPASQLCSRHCSSNRAQHSSQLARISPHIYMLGVLVLLAGGLNEVDEGTWEHPGGQQQQQRLPQEQEWGVVVVVAGASTITAP